MSLTGVRHLSREEAEGYVMGVLDESVTAGLEAHVVACLPCGRLLAAEARREVALATAIAGLSERPAPARRRPLLGRVQRLATRLSSAMGPLVVAAAAAVLLLAGPAPRLLPPSGAPAADRAELAAAHSEPLLACLIDGEAALCPLPERMSPERRSREVASDAMTVAGPALCRAPIDGTCSVRGP